MLRHRPLLLPLALLLMAASNGAAPAPDAAITALAPMTAAIVDGGQIQGRLKVSIAVSGADEAVLEENIPLVRAAAIGALSEFARVRATPYAAIDADQLRRNLDRAVRTAAPAVNHVLLVRAEARPA